MLENIDYTCSRIKSDHDLIPYIIPQNRLNKRPQSTILMEENIESHFILIDLRNACLAMTPEVLATSKNK